MHDLFKQLIERQFEAAFCMLSRCIDQCPPQLWDAPVANLRFCQVAFHVLLFADLYLGPNVDAIRLQPFHQVYAATFADYEEFQPQAPVRLYTRPFLQLYMAHTRQKMTHVIAAETPDSLAQPTGFDWLKFPRAEHHVYNIRHIHHHAAQLSLHLRLRTGEGVDWVGSRWREPKPRAT